MKSLREHDEVGTDPRHNQADTKRREDKYLCRDPIIQTPAELDIQPRRCLCFRPYRRMICLPPLFRTKRRSFICLEPTFSVCGQKYLLRKKKEEEVFQTRVRAAR